MQARDSVEYTCLTNFSSILDPVVTEDTLKTFEKVLAILALLIITTQTVRHGYTLWLEPRGSVLDKFDQPTVTQISKAQSVDELLKQYEPVRKAVDAEKLKRQPEDTPRLEYSDQEPYKSERQLREAINDWETKSKEIRALKIYWAFGLGFCVLGLVHYKRLNRWFGLTMIIAAFCEFIYWTSPTFLGPVREFDRLIGNKFTFSVLSLAVLLVVIQMLKVFASEDKVAAMAAKGGK